MPSTRQTRDLILDNIELETAIETTNLTLSGNLISTAVAGVDIVKGNVLSQDPANDRWVSFAASTSDALRVLGVSYSNLFPDLEGLSDELNFLGENRKL